MVAIVPVRVDEVSMCMEESKDKDDGVDEEQEESEKEMVMQSG